MDGMGVDLFATKGLEYVLVIGYLVLLVICRRMVEPSSTRSSTARLSFDLHEGLHFHQGHAWACGTGEGLMRVGIDDFAQKMLGSVTGVVLPRIGSVLQGGEAGWQVGTAKGPVPILSPVDGEVVALNEDVLRSPTLVNTAPYDRGWLLEVKVPSTTVATRNLLSGNVARAWMDDVAARLHRLSAETSDPASFEEAVSRVGIARALSPDSWDRLVGEFFLTSESPGEAVEDGGEPEQVPQPELVWHRSPPVARSW